MRHSDSRISFGLVLLVTIVWIACDQGTSPQGPVEGDRGITAAFKVPDVNALAASHRKSLRLYSVRSSNVNSDGTSALWQYEYLDSTGSVYCFHATFRSAEFDSISRVRTGIMLFTRSWFNSNIALDIAERNGGFDFRNRNPGCTITASVAQPLVPESSTYWYIAYRSATDRACIDFTIDAVTGSVSFPIIDRVQD